MLLIILEQVIMVVKHVNLDNLDYNNWGYVTSQKKDDVVLASYDVIMSYRIMHTISQRPMHNGAWNFLLIHGFSLVNARLLMAFGTAFYAIINK